MYGYDVCLELMYGCYLSLLQTCSDFFFGNIHSNVQLCAIGLQLNKIIPKGRAVLFFILTFHIQGRFFRAISSFHANKLDPQLDRALPNSIAVNMHAYFMVYRYFA
ncbi:hypothetical protein ACJX0J_019288 [Zea mays]